MKSKLLCFIVCLTIACLSANAQDPHFSQYFASPLTLNPATTGYFDGDYRFAVNERQQWWTVGSNYNTTSISADFKIMKDYIPEDDNLGIGISGIFDKSLSGALQSNYLSASGAYQMSLDGNQSLSLGLQLTFADRYFDLTRVSFASQFNTDMFDTSIPVNVNYNNANTRYLDVNAGLLYAFHLGESNFYLGASMYHMNRPVETLFSASGDKMAFRGTFHTGADVSINERSSILYSGVYMLQGAVTDQMFGAAYGLKLSDDNRNSNYLRLYGGMWYRIQDAYIPYVGVDYNDFSAGINYSIPQAAIYNYRPNTFEISLIYRCKFKVNQASLCPRF